MGRVDAPRAVGIPPMGSESAEAGDDGADHATGTDAEHILT